MKFRILDIIRYAAKINFFDSFRLFPQVLLQRQELVFNPDSRGQIRVRNHTSDVIAFKQVFLWEEYNYPIKGPVNVIIDGGANIGCASRWFKQRFPQAKIFSIEPEEKNFQLLQSNTANVPDVHCLKAGLWSKKCHLTVRTIRDDNWTFQVEETEETEGSIPATSINEIVESHNLQVIDILKLDIETAEKKVFEEQFENWIPRTRYIFVETHDFISKGCSRAVFNTILKYNFSLSVLGENVILVNDDLN